MTHSDMNVDPPSLIGRPLPSTFNSSSRYRGVSTFFAYLAVLLGLLITFVLFTLYRESRKLHYIAARQLSDQVVTVNDMVSITAPVAREEQLLAPQISDIDAKTLLAFDPDNYQIYISKNADSKSQIASITKLMSALVFEELYNDTDQIVVTKELPADLEHVMGLRVGDTISYEDALHSMLVRSYNDIPYILANESSLGFDGVIEQMNRKAAQLGMENSRFSNPAGYDDINNYSTANDLSKLVVYLLADSRLPQILNLRSTTVSYLKADGTTVKDTLPTTNKLLGKVDGLKGLKTGYTSGAGQCFIAYLDYGPDKRIITILLGSSENRFDETEKLLREISDSYRGL